jgi:hypothetical protein
MAVKIPEVLVLIKDFQMIVMKCRFKILAVCLGFALLSSYAYAGSCKQVAVVFRHAEDINWVDGEPNRLAKTGEVHAQGYANAFYTSLQSVVPGACRVTSIRVSNVVEGTDGKRFSANSYNTAKPFADSSGVLRTIDNLGNIVPSYYVKNIPIIYKGPDNNPFTDSYNWSPDAINSLVGEPYALYTGPDKPPSGSSNNYPLIGSTFMVFSRQALFGTNDSGKIDENRLLVKLLNKNAPNYQQNYNLISTVGSPARNFVYVYSNRQPDGTYNKVNVYFQAYVFSGSTEEQCYYIIPSSRGNSSIEKIIWQSTQDGCK